MVKTSSGLLYRTIPQTSALIASCEKANTSLLVDSVRLKSTGEAKLQSSDSPWQSDRTHSSHHYSGSLPCSQRGQGPLVTKSPIISANFIPIFVYYGFQIQGVSVGLSPLISLWRCSSYGFYKEENGVTQWLIHRLTFITLTSISQPCKFSQS